MARENRDYFGRTGFVGKVGIPSEPSPGKEVGLAGALPLLLGIVLEGVFGKEEAGFGAGTAGIS